MLWELIDSFICTQYLKLIHILETFLPRLSDCWCLKEIYIPASDINNKSIHTNEFSRRWNFPFSAKKKKETTTGKSFEAEHSTIHKPEYRIFEQDQNIISCVLFPYLVSTSLMFTYFVWLYFTINILM